MVNFEIASIIVFLAILGIIVWRDRKNFEFHSFITMRKWQGGLKFIDTVNKKYFKLINFLGNLGILIGISAGILGTIFLLANAIHLERGAGLVLPTAGGYQIPGPVVSVPFWYWLIAIFIIASVHETFHAIFIRMENVKVKNYGILLLLVLPIGAFVDPDQNKINKLPIRKKLKIFAAGSFSNFLISILAVVLFLFIAFVYSHTTTNFGVEFNSLISGSPAENVGLSGVILSVNNQSVNSTFGLAKILNGTSPGDNVSITTTNGYYQLTLGKNPENLNRSFIGVSGDRTVIKYNVLGWEGLVPTPVLNSLNYVVGFLQWLFLLSLWIGLVNMLPIRPLDGGLFFGEIFKKLFNDKNDLIINSMSIFLFLLILFNIFGIPLIQKFIG